MTQPEATSGWCAECQDCEPVRDAEYGGLIYPRSESVSLEAVEAWAKRHVEANPGHRPKIGQYQRMTLELKDFSPEVLRALFGGAAAGAVSDVEVQDHGDGPGTMAGRIPEFDE